ncbi:hypothetical protein GVY41_03090 [Frigidibacter albus]|uniref:Uncharacterized protein n=1 Tax=Frigidibacter albus TaxID=1465486 RepID=A0A6L8VDF4_9RHOB|nr:hypothetical protein [Frigidibacter albus]MZQ88337.1 hypothetical protein [Frigidibacter albus]NBE29989.1 hypothetical protein [Frigidibacter albus]GGH45992.1 hypothetical protein GCM10011341_06200 [Frigidibacter albus]
MRQIILSCAIAFSSWQPALGAPDQDVVGEVYCLPLERLAEPAQDMDDLVATLETASVLRITAVGASFDELGFGFSEAFTIRLNHLGVVVMSQDVMIMDQMATDAPAGANHDDLLDFASRTLIYDDSSGRLDEMRVTSATREVELVGYSCARR